MSWLNNVLFYDYSLGAQHDSFGNECPDATYLMSASFVQPNDTTKDTLETFSQCSGEYFVNHLSR